MCAIRSTSIGRATSAAGTPLEGKSALDVGCGAGLLTEPLRRLGAEVTGIDASPDVIAVAREHARAMGLEIEYRSGDVQELEGQFDLVTAMEVIEHVADPAAFVEALARRLAPDGLLLMSTPERDELGEAADDHGRRGARADPTQHA